MATGSLQGRQVTVVTVSDRCFIGKQVDLSGPAVAKILREAGAVVETLVVSDEMAPLVAALRKASLYADLVVTTGGTGIAIRDHTPEATMAVCERMLPGLPELIRREGAKKTPFAALSRGVCGSVGGCLILNLPGSPAGAQSSLETAMRLLPHALDLLAGQTQHTVG